MKRVESPYVAARFATTRLVDGELVRYPASEVHAKTVGTSAALCGVRTDTWAKFFGLKFVDVTAVPRCAACLDKLAAMGVAH